MKLVQGYPVYDLTILDSAGPEFLLRHGIVGRTPERGESVSAVFLLDLRQGRLDAYRGSAVAYQKTVLAGQSKDPGRLYREAGDYFGSSGLSIFFIPQSTADEPKVVRFNAFRNVDHFETLETLV